MSPCRGDIFGGLTPPLAGRRSRNPRPRRGPVMAGLRAVQEDHYALGVAGRLKDRALVVLQDRNPGGDTGGVILAWLDREADVGARIREECIDLGTAVVGRQGLGRSAARIKSLGQSVDLVGAKHGVGFEEGGTPLLLVAIVPQSVRPMAPA